MKTIKFNNKEYSIPQAWNEVSIRQQILAESLSNTQTHVKSLGVIAAYTGIDIQELKQVQTKDLLEVMSLLSFIDKPLSKEPLFEFEYKGDKYNVAETILKQFFQDWVAAQTAIAEYKDDNWKQLVYLLAIMAKRDGETLDNYDVNERAEHLMDVDVDTCHRVGAFFLSNQMASDFILTYSSPEVQQEILQNKLKELNHTLSKLKKQRGGKWYIRLWIFVIKMWIKFSMRQWEKYYNSSHSNNSTKSYNRIWKRLRLMKRREKTNSQ